MRSILIYLAYFARFLKARMEYKANFFVGIIANAFVSFSGLIFVLLLIDGESVAEINGWTRAEVLFIYGYSMISMAIFSTVAPNLYSFGDRYIIQGEFDRILLRPLNTLCQVLFESFNLESFGTLLAGLWLIITLGTSLGVNFGPAEITWLLVSGVSGGVILVSVFVFLASLSFHFEDRLGIGPPVYSLITFSRYPLPIFNRPIRFILSWVIPFAFAAFYPATYFLKHPGFEYFCYITPGVALVVAFVAYSAWEFGARRYSSTGT